jgi:hypothetical protein
MQASSLDGKSLADAGRILLIAAARADNRTAKLTYDKLEKVPQRQRGIQLTQNDPGKGPVVIEPVRATITLKGERYRITPLGPDMAPIAGAARESAAHQGGGSDVEIGRDTVSIWYLLERF